MTLILPHRPECPGFKGLPGCWCGKGDAPPPPDLPKDEVWCSACDASHSALSGPCTPPPPEEMDETQKDCCGDKNCCPYDHPHSGRDPHPPEAGERVTLHRAQPDWPWEQCDRDLCVDPAKGENWQHAEYVPARLLEEAIIKADNDAERDEITIRAEERERCARRLEVAAEDWEASHSAAAALRSEAAKIREGKVSQCRQSVQIQKTTFFCQKDTPHKGRHVAQVDFDDLGRVGIYLSDRELRRMRRVRPRRKP